MTLFQRGERLLAGLEPAAGGGGHGVAARGAASRCGSAARSPRPGGRAPRSCPRRRTASCAATRCWSPSAAGRRTPATSAWRPSGSSPGDYLDVDDTLQVTGLPWLYGVGDVNGRAQLTHMGKYQARQAGAAIVARAPGREVDTADWSPFVATADERATPSVVFTDPAGGRASG